MLRVGPGYASFGVPFLRTDNLRVETKAEQRFLDRQVSAAAFYRRDEDNLRETKDNSTVMNAFGAQVGVAVKDYPYLRLSYAPLSQQNKRVSDSLNVKNDVTAMTAVTGYTFRTKGGMVSSTTASLNYQEGKTQSGLGAYITRNALVSEALIIGAPLMFMLTGGWNATEVDTTTTRLVTIDASATYTAFGVWQNTIALSTVRDAVKRTSISFTSGAPIGTIAMFSLSVEHTTFDDPSASANNYTETVVRAILSKSW
jgi:hypothetical protein